MINDTPRQAYIEHESKKKSVIIISFSDAMAAVTSNFKNENECKIRISLQRNYHGSKIWYQIHFQMLRWISVHN